MDHTELLREAEDRLSWYVNGCPCPGVPCVSHCATCNKTQGLINRLREALALVSAGLTPRQAQEILDYLQGQGPAPLVDVLPPLRALAKSGT